MVAETSFDYYYGDKSNQFSFYRIPCQLVTGERFKRLSTDAKLLYQLVDGSHRREALKQAGMLEVRADVYEMPLTEARRCRKEHRNKLDLPIPSKLVPVHPIEPEKPAEPPKAAESPAAPGEHEEIPEDFKLPIAKEGQAEIITTLRVNDIHHFEGH